MKNQFEPGQMVETTVVAISSDTVFIDLGLKSEGFVDKSEFTDDEGNVSIKEGDRIKVYFASATRDELHFTTKLAGQNAGKDMLESAFQNGVPVEGHVTQEIKGGFEVMVGSTRAFCPYSQMGYRERKEPAEYVGKHLTFKIQEYKNEGKNIVLSNRVILAAEAEEKKAALAQKLQLGSIVKGTVSRIESYGAFVNIEGFEALLPVSEISHVHVNDVHDVLKIGQEVEAKIIRADWTKEKVSLSTKELEADPWDGIKAKFPVGTKIEGKISRVADFGLFINLAPAVDGLVHISKLPVERNTNLKKVYKPGDSLAVTVDRVDTDEKRISLSPVVSSEEEVNAAEYQKAHASDDDGETYNPFAALLKK
ncbi:MAG: S1 RNA-binding domain-containing protein [Treponema sp.]|nr:S1 RNA-binding domain-containing protein [Treponema sp.]